MPARGGNVKVRFGADTKDLERGAARAGRAVDSFQRKASRPGLLGAGTKHLLGYAAGITSVAAAAAAAKDAVKFTENLAKSSAALARTTGLDVKTASEWVETARLRNVEAQQLNRGFVTLAKNMRQVELGSKTATRAFADLGVSQEALQSGDMNRVLMETADAFKAMPDGAKQAALAQQLFGRQAQTLIPLLNQGSVKLREQLGLVDQYGVALDKKGVQQALKAVEAQRKWQLAMDGLKVSLASGLLPVLSRGIGAAANFIREMRQGEGAGGRFAAKVREVWQNIQPTVSAIGRMASAVGRFVAEHPGVQRMLAVLIPVGAALKVAGGASTVAGLTRLAGSLRQVGTAGKGAAVGATALSNIHLAAWFAGALITARNLAKSGIDPLNSKTITFRRALDFADRQGGAFLRTIGRIVPGMRDLGDMLHRVNQEVQGKMGKVRQYGQTWRDVANDIALVGQAISDLPSIPELSPNYPGTNVPQVPRGPGRRRGGMVYQAGGLVPSLLSPGEMVIGPGGGAHIVPGAPRAADSVPMMLPSGSAVLTWSGQDMLARGASLAGAVAAQAPHFARGGWVRTGATIDNTRGQHPAYSDHGGMSFAELLVAGQNAGLGPEASKLLGIPQGRYGMRMGTSILARMPGSSKSYRIWKNDNGSGQPGNAHYTIDLHGKIASRLGWHPNQDIEIKRDDGSTDSAAGSPARTVRWQTYQPPGRTTGQVSRASWEAGWQSGVSDPFGYGRAQERTDDYNTGRARLFGVWTSHSRTTPARPATHTPQSGGGRAAKVVQWAKAQLGYHEGPGNRNKYGPSAPWCGYFVQAGLKNAGLPISQGMGYVPDIRRMIDAGAAPFSGPVSPGAMRAGDVITWSGHTGFYIGGGQAIHGNYGDAVRQTSSTAPGGIVKAGRPRYRTGGIVQRFRSGGVALGSVGQSYGQDIYGRPWRAGRQVETREAAYTALWGMLNPGIGPGTEGAIKSAYARALTSIDRLGYGDLRAFIADARRVRLRSFGGPKVTQTMRSRVQRLIDYAGGALARQISRPVGVSDSVQESISNTEGVFDDKLTLSGVAPESREGIAKRIEFNNKSITRLWKRKDALRQALARLKRVKPRGWQGQAKQITSEIAEIDRQVTGLAAANIRLRKEMLTAPTNAQIQAGESAAPADTEISADAQAQLDQANVRATVAQRAANLSEAFIRTAFGSGDIGSGGQWAWTSAGGSGAAFGPGMSITINTLHPGDSQTLAAIANAATAGMGQQGFVTSPRAASGV